MTREWMIRIDMKNSPIIYDGKLIGTEQPKRIHQKQTLLQCQEKNLAKIPELGIGKKTISASNFYRVDKV